MSSGYYVYNIGSGNPISLNKLKSIIQSLIKDKLNIKIVQSRSIDTIITFANTDMAKKDLGFVPKIMLEDGIKYMIEWFRQKLYEK